MPLIVCHSPKGGTGTTFLSARLARGLADAGANVSVLTMAAHDTMPLHFGLPPTTNLSGLTAPAENAVVVAGIDLRHWHKAPADPDFIRTIHDLGYLEPGMERVLVLDIPACESAFAQRMINHACAHLCPLDASPDTLALLPQMFDEAGRTGLARTFFVINRLDDTRRLARHNAAFIRELAGQRLIGRVRLDEAVPEAIAMLQTLGRYAPSSAALADARRIAETLCPELDNDVASWIAPQSSSRAA